MSSEYSTQNSFQNSFVPSVIYDVSAKIASSQEITELEQAVLQKAFLEDTLSDEEHQVINRIYRACRLGRLQIAKKNSA